MIRTFLYTDLCSLFCISSNYLFSIVFELDQAIKYVVNSTYSLFYLFLKRSNVSHFDIPLTNIILQNICKLLTHKFLSKLMTPTFKHRMSNELKYFSTKQTNKPTNDFPFFFFFFFFFFFDSSRSFFYPFVDVVERLVIIGFNIAKTSLRI